MMRKDYQIHFDELRSLLFHRLGAVCTEESELLARFALRDGWSLLFDCERYYGPSWSISITPPDRSTSYEVRLLMEAFKDLKGAPFRAPTIRNQVEFLVSEKAQVFGDIGFYASAYESRACPE